MDGEREYETTPQTAAALKGIVKGFADARGLNSERYVYKILSGEALDEYHRFKFKLFRPVLQCSLDSARIFVEDLQSEIDRAEKVQFIQVDHGQVIAALLSVVSASATGASREETLRAMRDAHRLLGLYLRAAGAESDGEVVSMKRPMVNAK